MLNHRADTICHNPDEKLGERDFSASRLVSVNVAHHITDFISVQRRVLQNMVDVNVSDVE